MRKEIALSRLKELVSYCPETGLFTSNKTGRVVGGNANGYVSLHLEGTSYLAHRLAWLYMTGSLPAEFIDHANGVRNDNRWCNIREASMLLNNQNKLKPQKKNTTGLIGVSVHHTQFTANIFVNGERIFLGRFKTAQEAHLAYLEGKKKHHPFRTFYP